MDLGSVLTMLLFCVLLAMLPVILIVGRRKQKRRRFPDIDMGPRRWDGAAVTHTSYDSPTHTTSAGFGGGAGSGDNDCGSGSGDSGSCGGD
ncbi:MAG: hypothetical protein QM809_01410 [Gordonia sp. (in: high G+C Gram-positive bacteria)]|uniref:hypothetical protein n=1 Tax=Gordonia sp. (in: high G+C Gram-positive bacteria) TaxID=84139 RepID=UPI0039E2B22F